MDIPQSIDECAQLARDLCDERQRLVEAWESLEREQRRIALEGNVESSQDEVVQLVEQRELAIPQKVAAAPNSNKVKSGQSRKGQFQQLQREMDRRR